MDSCAKCARLAVGTPSPPWGGEGSWNRYLRLQGFQDVWEGRDQTEQDKYGDIVACLAEEEEGRKSAENRIVDAKRWWSERQRFIDLDQHEEELGAVFAAADEVQLAWAGRTNANHLHKLHEQSCKELRPQLYDKIKVWLGDLADVNSKELTVATTLMVQRYYLGAHGGDYIFRYRQEDNENGIEDVGPDTESEEDEENGVEGGGPGAESATTTCGPWENPRLWSALGPEPAALQDQFQYCGQVPRHLKEYTARLKVVLPAVVLVVVSLIGFAPDGDNMFLPEELRQLCRLGLHSPRGSFVELYRIWEQRLPQVPVQLRDRVRRNAAVLEFAHFLAKMADAGARDLVENFRAVVLMLEEATGWTLLEMVGEADAYTERRAVHELLHAKKFEHVLVFQDEKVKNIHDFYNYDNFRADPSHPERRYETVDVSAALAVSDRLQSIGSEDELSEPELEFGCKFETTGEDEDDEDEDDDEEPDNLLGSGKDDSSDEDFSDFDDDEDEDDERPTKRRRTSNSAAAPKNKRPAKKPEGATNGRGSPIPSQSKGNYTIATGQKRRRSGPARTQDQRVPRSFHDLDFQDDEHRSLRRLTRPLDS